MRLIANKRLRRGGGSIEPGEHFEVRSKVEGRLLKAIGHASEPETEAPMPDERDLLRTQAEQLGIEVDGRWGVARLEEEIAAAQRRVSRRTMTAETRTAQASDEPGQDTAAPRYQRRDMRPENES